MPVEADHLIRRADVRDIPDFIDLRRRMFEEVGFEDTSAMTAASHDYFARAIPSGEFVALVAVSADETIVGSAGIAAYTLPPKPLEPSGRFGYISSMYVLPDQRKRGIAQRLLDGLITTADDMDLVWVTLHASEMGQPLYERSGFGSWNEMGLHIPTAIADRKAAEP